MDDIQSWWEVPSIVHFCNVFSPFCKDLCPLNINEFEHAIEDNSNLLTDMAMRFIKISGFYDPNTNEWWNKMKRLFDKKCIIYNFENSLDSVTYFDELTRKQKVVALYILCHIILDVRNVKTKLSQQPKLWSSLNVKPLGYDLNKSVYWYFGTTKLYKEDFEKTIDVSTNSSTLNDLNRGSCPPELIGSGKWSIVCDNNESWNLFASNIECSNNVNIKHLHNSVCNIINNLPNLKRRRTYYKYLKPLPRLPLRSTRSLRTTYVYDEYDSALSDSDTSIHVQPLPRNSHKRSLRSYVNDENDTIIKSTDNSKHTQYSQNAQVNQTEHSDLFASLSTVKNDKKQDLTHNIKVNINENVNVHKMNNKTTIKSLLNSVTTVNNSVNESDLIKIRQACLEQEVRVNIMPYDSVIDQNQENPQNSGSIKKKLRTSTQFQNKTKQSPFQDLNY